ncbi:MAG: YqzL family protein [Bacillaceae bacterium]
MLNFTWNVFKNTGAIEMYLLYKEIEQDSVELSPNEIDDELVEDKPPIS